MKAIHAGWALAVFFLPGSTVLAQSTSASALLKVNATLPISLGPGGSGQTSGHYPGRFRVITRVLSAQSEAVPFVTIGAGGLRGDYITGWQAFTSSGAQCKLVRSEVQGVDVFRGRTTGTNIGDLQQSAYEPQSVADGSRPSMVRTDFMCDASIEPGDSVMVQMRFFVRQRGRWRAADYTFENLPVQFRQ